MSLSGSTESGGSRAWNGPVRLESPALTRGPIRSVYVHAPFCARRCFYCDFAVTVRRSGEPGPWVAALGTELEALAREGRFELAGTLDTLYVGGGTPSLLGPRAMESLAEVLGRERLDGPELEWTAEANPESFTPELGEAWRRAGANRVSLGLQSFQDDALRWMGRSHRAEGAATAVRTARTAGFHNVSVDLIFGLPGHLGRSWSEELERVVELEVEHVSLYGLTVERETPLGRAVHAGREEVAGDARFEEEYLEAAERLAAAGYEHYEVSNFARPGRSSAHNRAYWSGAPYLGLGNSSHSYLHPFRRWNLRDWTAYQRMVREGGLPVDEEECLDASAHRLERIWLALRTRRGLSLSDLGEGGRRVARRWESRDLARTSDGVVRLTPEGWLALDRLTVELDDALERDFAPASGSGTAS